MIDIQIQVTGDAQLDAALSQIVAEDGPKSLNKALRSACREAVKTIVRPAVLQLVPHRYGTLESQIVVRAVPGAKRGTFGFYCGFPDRLFTGDTFYGGFIEFGWDHYKGVTVEADSFLREALYPKEAAIRGFVQDRMRQWLAQANAVEYREAA